MKMETRFSDGVSAPGGVSPKISGYAVRWGAISEDLGGFHERIARGAFLDSLNRIDSDVRALFNHDCNYVLGRQRNGTLRLEEDALGLRFEVDPPDVQWARDLITSIRRHDIDQMSFGFSKAEDSWETSSIVGGKLRTILKCRLGDISVVTQPAYTQTSAVVRTDAERIERFRRAKLETDTDMILISLRQPRRERRPSKPALLVFPR